LTPPTSVETSAILALAVLADDFASLISPLICCWTLASSGLDLFSQLVGVGLGLGLGLAGERTGLIAGLGAAASRSSFIFSRWRDWKRWFTVDASRRLGQFGGQSRADFGDLVPQVVGLHDR